jgi:uncharacterized SAM-dependent methyltransferase
MNIEVLLTETEIAQEFTESIEARDLPEKFFYWFQLSVRSWRALAQDSAHQNLQNLWDRMSEQLRGCTGHFRAQIPIVSFGAGDGLKDRRLIQSMQAAGRSVRYFPVDASQALLETACGAAEDDEADVLGIKADISSPVHLVLASDACEPPRLILMAGNTLGGFDPLEQIRHVAATLREGDRLALDVELYSNGVKDVAVPSLQHAFAFAPLRSIGIQEEDGEIRFDVKRDERHSGLYMVARHFRATRDLNVSVLGKNIMLERGERIFMNFRYLFTPEAFRWLLESHGRLKILHTERSSDQGFALAVCEKYER